MYVAPGTKRMEQSLVPPTTVLKGRHGPRQKLATASRTTLLLKRRLFIRNHFRTHRPSTTATTRPTKARSMFGPPAAHAHANAGGGLVVKTEMANAPIPKERQILGNAIG